MTTTSIGNIARVQSGFAFKSADFRPTGVRLLRNTNIIPRRIYWDDLACIDFTQYKRFRAYQLMAGDILLSLDRPIVSTGIKVAQVRNEDIPALLVQRVGRFCIDTSKVDSDYLYFFVQSSHFLRNIIGHEQSLGVPHISPSQVEAIELPLPSLNEQRRIATQLKAQLTEAEAARWAAQAVGQDAALLRSRLLNKAFKSFGDEVPYKALGKHASTTSGATPQRGNKQYWEPAEVPWVKTGEVAFASITRTEEAVSKLALAECSLTLLPPKTVLVAMYGQGKTRGQSAILEVPATTNQACFAILPNDTWEPEFLYYWLISSYQDLRDLSDDRGGNQANLNGAMLKNIKIPAPDRARQRTIARHVKSVLQRVDALVASNKATMSDLETLPQRLLTHAFEY